MGGSACKIAQSPVLNQTHAVFEGGISNRDWCSNRGSLASYPSFFLEASNQGESQDGCGCEVADEPVVVLNVQPMKASNGVEEKTGWTFNLI